MKTSRLIMILQLLLVLPLASCEKLTDLVKGDVTCKIDGRSWTPYADDFKLREAECRISNKGEQVFITATNSQTSEKVGILIATPGVVVSKGKYSLNSDRYLSGSYYLFDIRQFITGNGYQGEVEILNIDTVKSRIAGKFHFSCYNEKNKQVVVVSEGRFDIRYTIHE